MVDIFVVQINHTNKQGFVANVKIKTKLVQKMP
jgi:hypothetical protein